MKLITKISIVLLAVGAVSQGVFADDIPTDKKAEFRKLVLKRNQMHRELFQLDRKAAELLKHGRDTTRVNGEQVTVQDRMDLNQLRLETMAARYGLAIPELPKLTEDDGLEKDKKQYGAEAFERGRQRTLMEIKRQTFRLLRSIDYSFILSNLKEK